MGPKIISMEHTLVFSCQHFPVIDSDLPVSCFLCEVPSHSLRTLEGPITATPIPVLPKEVPRLSKKSQMALAGGILCPEGSLSFPRVDQHPNIIESTQKR